MRLGPISAAGKPPVNHGVSTPQQLPLTATALLAAFSSGTPKAQSISRFLWQ
jgi:hypothetical protein